MDKKQQLQFVSLQLALTLKQHGFNWPVTTFFNPTKDKAEGIAKFAKNFNAPSKAGTSISRPTLALAEKWLRDVKGIVICIDWRPDLDPAFSYKLDSLDLRLINDEIDSSSIGADTYEACQSLAIEDALQFIEVFGE